VKLMMELFDKDDASKDDAMGRLVHHFLLLQCMTHRAVYVVIAI